MIRFPPRRRVVIYPRYRHGLQLRDKPVPPGRAYQRHVNIKTHSGVFSRITTVIYGVFHNAWKSVQQFFQGFRLYTDPCTVDVQWLVLYFCLLLLFVKAILYLVLKCAEAYSNRCSAPKCKQHELMPVICNDCRLNYCLRHRHPIDHNCKGFQGTGRSVSSAGAAAAKRVSANGPSTSRQRNNAARPVAKAPQQTLLHGLGKELDRERRERQQSNIRSMQANLSEDEALARALQLSQMESKSDKPMTQEEKDLALARQLQAQEEEERRRRRGGQGQRNNSSSESSCKIS
ncbi:uncharacterized protein LOC100182904 isoform X1 [Ciona intestinalis]